MIKKDAESRIGKLRATIERHRYLYHVRDKQEISDAALDSLKHELSALEQEHPDLIIPTSPTQRVGGKPLGKFQKVRHSFPMLSLEDIFSFDEFREWEDRLCRITKEASFDYYAELKMDGLAVSLEYRDRIFFVGSTRGDGKEGENVTQNLKTIEAIPLELRLPTDQEITLFLRRFSSTVNEKKFRARVNSLSGTVEVRGEVFMTKKTLDALNREQKKKGEASFANPRNVAAGSIRQLDPAITASRKLNFFGYALMREQEFGISTHEQAHELLALLGVPCNPHNGFCKNAADVKKYYQTCKNRRNSLPYLTDGVVVVVNSNALLHKLGVIGKAPRGMIAYKFPAEQATTIVESVTFQVGRTGALTPVAHFAPVSVAGTTVTNATLHNIDEISRLDVRIHDTVIIEKAGDIIPKVVKVLRQMRTGKEKRIFAPLTCPACGSTVKRLAGEVALYCSNKKCFGKEKEAIIHFVSKKAFNIEGLGEKIVEQLMNGGLIQNTADIFSLKQGDVEPLERFASKRAENLIAAIEARKKVDLSRFVYALGIRHVGEQTAHDLSNRFGALDKILSASREEIESVPNVGATVGTSIFEYFHDAKNQKIIRSLFARGVHINQAPARHVHILAGKTFVLTGELESMTRDGAQETIRDLGGDVSSSVSAKTDYVIAGAHPGSKIDKAKKQGIPILSEEKFLDMIKK